MEIYIAMEESYKNGYAKGFEDGKKAGVKHGRWIDRYSGKYANPLYDCSECKNRAPYKFEDDSLHIGLWLQDLTDYCPNCGAYMRKENENAD